MILKLIGLMGAMFVNREQAAMYVLLLGVPLELALGAVFVQSAAYMIGVLLLLQLGRWIVSQPKLERLGRFLRWVFGPMNRLSNLVDGTDPPATRMRRFVKATPTPTGFWWNVHRASSWEWSRKRAGALYGASNTATFCVFLALLAVGSHVTNKTAAVMIGQIGLIALAIVLHRHEIARVAQAATHWFTQRTIHQT